MTDPQTNPAPATDDQIDLSRIPDPKLGEAVAGARRIRTCARLAGLGLAAASFAVGGPHWLLGAVLGWLVVEINLSLMVRALARSADWRGRSLKPTLIRFYLAFGATGLVCFLIIKNGWGQPLAFLLGLLSFFLGLSLGLISLALKKPGRPS